MAGTFTNLNYHVIFSTKDRALNITAEMQERLYEYISGVIRGQGGVNYAIGGVADHVHILLRLKPTSSLSDIVRDVKANSSGWIHQTFSSLRGFKWQEGFGGFTVSKSQLIEVTRYIENQEAHHGRKDFKTEFLEFLNRHEVEYDERYIWT